MYNLQCTTYNVKPTMYNLQCTTYNVQPTMYNLQCTACNIQPTVNISQIKNENCTVLSVWVMYRRTYTVQAQYRGGGDSRGDQNTCIQYRYQDTVYIRIVVSSTNIRIQYRLGQLYSVQVLGYRIYQDTCIQYRYQNTVYIRIPVSSTGIRVQYRLGYL